MVKFEKDNEEDDLKENKKEVLTGAIKALREEKAAIIDAASKLDVQPAVEALLALEKRARLVSEWEVTTDAAVAILRVCKQHGDWKELNASITLLAKRRSQHRKVLTAVTKEGMSYLSVTPSKECKLELLDTLRAVSDGKMYLEIERAHLTKILSEIKELDGDISAAASILQEVQVETYGSMEKSEKIDYILEQMRLCLAKKDFIRAFIISKKIDPKHLLDDNMQSVKLKYYKLMIEYNTYNDDTGALAKCYESIFSTPVVLSNTADMESALSHYILFLALTVPSDDQAESLQKLLSSEEKKLREIPAYKNLIKYFTTQEVAPWPLPDNNTYKTHPIFNDASVFGDHTTKWWSLLHKRVVQHNILVVARYYTRINLSSLSKMLQMPVDQTEDTLADMVVTKIVEAKINRPAGTIDFTKTKSPNSILTAWSSDISELLKLVDSTSHLITKENLHK